ncbi:Uma2 family endonuclease [Gordonia effusa]|nr:Uma2 family endonuclease [Gordonia effusa]
MTSGRTPTAGSGPMTVSDLGGMPNDGRRYELIDGVLVVSPAPGTRHQSVVGKLFAILDAACPPNLAVIIAPYAVRDGDSVELQPDVLVGNVDDFTAQDLPTPPLLAVEVLSPSTALHDLNTKKAAYERLSVPSYWIIDPTAVTFTVFELEDGRYVEKATVAGSESLVVQLPYPVEVTPVDLLGPFR